MEGCAPWFEGSEFECFNTLNIASLDISTTSLKAVPLKALQFIRNWAFEGSIALADEFNKAATQPICGTTVACTANTAYAVPILTRTQQQTRCSLVGPMTTIHRMLRFGLRELSDFTNCDGTR